jgi:hypothetical protein
MMKTKDWLRWLRDHIHTYNLFIPDEDEYDDNNDNLKDPATVVKHQRYATRLYVPLLISKLNKIVFCV